MSPGATKWTAGLLAVIALATSLAGAAPGRALAASEPVSDPEAYRTLVELAPAAVAEPVAPSDEQDRQERAAETETKQEKTLAQRAAALPKEFAAEGIQAAVLMLAITGVALVQNEARDAAAHHRPVDKAKIASLYARAAIHILASGDLLAGMIGSGAVSVALKRPLAILQALVAKQASREIFAKLLESGVHSAFLFAGWEAGAQLLKEARLQLKDQKDYERSERLLTMGLGGLASLAFPDSPDLVEDRRVFGLVMGNLLRTLLFDGDLRSTWFYNTWRQRIATGDFAVLVSSMAACGAVGTAVFPGGGTLVGMAFGVAGGLVAMNTPQLAKDALTAGIKETRLLGHRARLAANRLRLDLKSFDTEKTLLARHEDREELMNVLIEGIFLFKTRKDLLDTEVRIASQSIEALKAAEGSAFSFNELLRAGMDLTSRSVLPFGGHFLMEMTGQNSLSLMIQEDQAQILVYDKALDRALELTGGVYAQEKIDLGADLKSRFPEEARRIDVLGRITHQRLLAWNPSAEEFALDPEYQKDPQEYVARRERLAAAEISVFHDRGYREDRQLEAWDQAIRELTRKKAEQARTAAQNPPFFENSTHCIMR